MTLVSATLRVNLMIVDYDYTRDDDADVFQIALTKRLGDDIKNTAIFLFGREANGTYDRTTLSKSSLLIPKYDLNGKELHSIFRNNDMTRFWDRDTAGGQTLNFSISGIPVFKFTGVNHIKNYLAVYDPVEINTLNAGNPPFVKYISNNSWVGYTSYNFSTSDTTRLSLATASWFNANLGEMFKNIDISINKAVSKMELENLGFSGGTTPVTTLFTQLADVSIIDPPVANLGLHYNAVNSKFEQTPEFAVVEATRTVLMDTTGAVTMLGVGDVSLASSTGEGTLSAQTGIYVNSATGPVDVVATAGTARVTGNLEVEITAETGKVLIDSTAGMIDIKGFTEVAINCIDGNSTVSCGGTGVFGGDNGAILGSTAGFTELQCGIASNDYCRINTANETAEQYATKIQAFNSAIPNTQYVSDAITALAPNIYNTNGTLTGARSVAQDSNAITFANGEFNVDALTSNINLNTSDGNATLSATGAGNVSVSSSTGLVSVTTGGTIEISGDTAVNITATSGFITLEPNIAGSVNIGGLAPAIYASNIASVPSALTNVQYVTDAIANASNPVASTYKYTIDTTAIVAPPASGHIRYNNATQTSATNLYFSHIDGDVRDIEILLTLYPIGTKIVFQEDAATANYQSWTTTLAPAVTVGSYVDFTVTLNGSGGTGTTGFPDNTKILAFFITGSTGGGGGSVTNVSALTLGTTGTDLSSTVANSTTTPVITLQVPNASATNRGALLAADWTTFNSKQDALTLTTTGSSGASTLIGTTLNIPQYATGVASASMILANPYPLCKIGANITPATTQYYFNATCYATATATGIRFMLGITGSGDEIRLALYRSNVDWDIATSTLIGMTAVVNTNTLTAMRITTLPLTAVSGENLNLTAGESIILACYSDGTTSYWRGSTETSSTQAWSNTTNLPAGLIFPTNPAAKATNAGTIPMLELV